MRLLGFFLVLAFLLLAIGCDQSPSDVAAGNLEESSERTIPKEPEELEGLPEYASVISEGMTLYFYIPRGEISILSSSNNFDRPNPKAGLYAHTLLKGLQISAQIGLISFEEIPQDEFALRASMWTRRYKITFLQKALDLEDKEKSDEHKQFGDCLVIPMGSKTVTSIVKAESYHREGLPQSDDYLLCVGLYRFEPTPFYFEYATAVNAEELVEQYKFRAIIKVNPFTKSYSYVDSDWGFIDRDTWVSENVN